MRKEIIVTNYIDVCDFCGKEESHDNWVYHCEVCDKAMCEECASQIEHNYVDDISVCPDCVNKDFSEYRNLSDRKGELYKELDEIIAKQREILKNLK